MEDAQALAQLRQLVSRMNLSEEQLQAMLAQAKVQADAVEAPAGAAAAAEAPQAAEAPAKKGKKRADKDQPPQTQTIRELDPERAAQLREQFATMLYKWLKALRIIFPTCPNLARVFKLYSATYQLEEVQAQVLKTWREQTAPFIDEILDHNLNKLLDSPFELLQTIGFKEKYLNLREHAPENFDNNWKYIDELHKLASADASLDAKIPVSAVDMIVRTAMEHEQAIENGQATLEQLDFFSIGADIMRRVGSKDMEVILDQLEGLSVAAGYLAQKSASEQSGPAAAAAQTLLQKMAAAEPPL